MAYKLIIALILVFYFLCLIQNSLLVRFSIFGIVPNLILVSVCLLGFLSIQEKSVLGEKKLLIGLSSVVIGGLLLDIFSRSFLGISILLLSVVYFFIREVTHLLKDFSKKYSVLYFISIFIVSLITYEFLFRLLSYFLNNSFVSPYPVGGYTLLALIIYNLFFGLLGFYLLKKASILKL